MHLTCFLTAASSEDTSTIREILGSHGVSVRDAFDFMAGENISTSLPERIRRSSFVVAVISHASANVFFEMGLAQGIGKPILILGKPDESVPFLQTQPHLRASGDDRELLEIVIAQFVDEVKSGKAKIRKSVARAKTTKATPQAIKSYLEQIKDIRTTTESSKFEDIVAAVLEAIGTGAVRSEFGADKGVDFALWNDHLTHTLGNPLLIEVKHGSLSETRLKQAEATLQRAIEKADARAALLFYLDREGKRFPSKYWGEPWIFRWDFEDFLRELLTHTFEEAVLAKRNKIVHSAES